MATKDQSGGTKKKAGSKVDDVYVSIKNAIQATFSEFDFGESDTEKQHIMQLLKTSHQTAQGASSKALRSKLRQVVMEKYEALRERQHRKRLLKQQEKEAKK